MNLVALDKSSCCGCAACLDRCPLKIISIQTDAEGFRYAMFDKQKCVHCNICKQVCPVLSHENEIQEPETVQFQRKAYAARNKNREIQKRSSSGGVFSALAEYVINQHGVVYGAEMREDLTVWHRWVEERTQLNGLLGSKYLQSHTEYVYSNIQEQLAEGRLVLYCGTPCQVAAVRKRFGKNSCRLLLVSVVCHGVPSEKVWNEYVTLLTKKKKQIRHVSFRDKIFGWYNYSMKVEYDNGQVYRRIRGGDPFMRAFINNLDLRPSCYQCRFKGCNDPADLTLGDFWGVNRINSQAYDKDGVSLVIARNQKGIDLLRGIAQSIELCDVDMREAEKSNAALVSSAKWNPQRDQFLQNVESRTMIALMNEYCPETMKAKVRRMLKELKMAVRRQ